MRYKTGYCFTAKELFETMNKKELNITTKMYKEYKSDTLLEFCAQVISYFFYLVVLDIIENNVTFVFSLNSRERSAQLSVKCFADEVFRKQYSMGRFDGIDFLQSNFKGYQLYMFYKKGTDWREKPCFINKKIKDVFYEKINNGMTYY